MTEIHPVTETIPHGTERPKQASELSEIFHFLKGLKEFAAIRPQDLQSLADVGRFTSVEAGDYITTEGEEESSNGFIVVSGCLAMVKTSLEGKELIVELLQRGDIFGLLLMLAAERLPSQLSARALQRSRILWIPLESFTYMLKSHPVLFKEFVAHLLICLQSSYRLSRGLAHDRVEVRIASVLSSLAIKFAQPLSKEKPMTVLLTRQQLADLTGTTGETAIRITRAMQQDGLIDILRPGRIRIVDLAALQDLAES